MTYNWLIAGRMKLQYSHLNILFWSYRGLFIEVSELTKGGEIGGEGIAISRL